MGNGREVSDVGAPGHSGVRHLLHNNHKFHLQPWVLWMFHHLNPRYRCPQKHGNQILVPRL